MLAIQLACAIVFKSGSTELKSKILARVNEAQLKNLQQLYGLEEFNGRFAFEDDLSNPAIARKAKQLNQIVKVADWQKLATLVLTAAEHYRQSGMGGDNGLIRAENLILKFKSFGNRNFNHYHVQSDLITCIAAVVLKSSSKKLTATILDFLSQITISEKQIKQLIQQYCVTNEDIDFKNRRMSELDRIYLFITDLEKLASRFERVIALCLAIAKPEDRVIALQFENAFRRICSNAEGVLNTFRRLHSTDIEMQSAEQQQAELKLRAFYLLINFVLASDSIGELKRQVNACLFLNEDCYNPIVKCFRIPYASNHTKYHSEVCWKFSKLQENNPEFVTEIRHLFFTPLPEQANELSDPVQNWVVFESNFILAAKRYCQTRMNIFEEGENRAFNLIKALEEIKNNPLDDKKKKQLALLACTIVSDCSNSTVLAEKILLCTGFSQRQMKQLGAFYFGESADDAFAATEERLLNSGAKLGKNVTFFANTRDIKWDEIPAAVLSAKEKYQTNELKNKLRAENFSLDFEKAAKIPDEQERKKAWVLLICALTLHSAPTRFIRCVEEETKLDCLQSRALQIEFNLTNRECEDKAKSWVPVSKKTTLFFKKPRVALNPDANDPVVEMQLAGQ